MHIFLWVKVYTLLQADTALLFYHSINTIYYNINLLPTFHILKIYIFFKIYIFLKSTRKTYLKLFFPNYFFHIATPCLFITFWTDLFNKIQSLKEVTYRNWEWFWCPCWVVQHEVPQKWINVAGLLGVSAKQVCDGWLLRNQIIDTYRALLQFSLPLLPTGGKVFKKEVPRSMMENLYQELHLSSHPGE